MRDPFQRVTGVETGSFDHGSCDMCFGTKLRDETAAGLLSRPSPVGLQS